MKKQRTYKLIASKSVFTISLIVIILTILGVYFWGLGKHHTFYENSIISTTIISIAFFAFVTSGLYRGVKLKDNVGKVIDKDAAPAKGDSSGFDLSGLDGIPGEPIVVGDDLGGIILGVILWILFAILLAFALWFFGNVLITAVLAFIAMLYWIFFRALRLVFKNSNKSKGNLMESIKWGFTYTVLYNFWIYGIFILTHYLKH